MSLRALALASALFLASPVIHAGVGQARPWIGIAIEKGDKGVKVKDVRGNTPAETAGLKASDQVVAIDGVAVKEPGELIDVVQKKGVGASVKLSVLRDGKSLDITLALAARPDEAQMLRDHLLGKPAPAFAPEKLVGPHAAGLADLKGQVVVVEFWATWCGPCRATMPTLSEWQKKYGAAGLKVIGVSAEESDVLAGFLAKHKVGYTIARDGDGKLSAGFAVPAIPTILVIDRGGVVRFAEVGGGDTLARAEAVFKPLLAAKPTK